MSQITAPPNADEILGHFRLPIVRLCGVFVLPCLEIVKIVCRVTWNVRGIEHVTETLAPVIFASNHQSHLDTHVILDVIPQSQRKRTAAAAAYDHFADREGTSQKKRFVQFLVSSIWNAFSIERETSPLRSIRTMQTLILKGWSILIYPEGTRSRTGDIAKFKPGLTLLAKKTRCPVIPICILGTKDVLPEASCFPRKGTVSVSFGAPILFQDGDTAESFMLRIEDAVKNMAAQ